jgi:hypothetical protein
VTDVIEDLHPTQPEAVYLLGRIAKANTMHEVFSLEGDFLAFMWRLETDEGVSSLDIDNLRVVFKMASEKRVHELVSLKGGSRRYE